MDHHKEVAARLAREAVASTQGGKARYRIRLDIEADEAFRQGLTHSVDATLGLLQMIFPGEAGRAAAGAIDTLAADTIDACIIGSALQTASQQLRVALTLHHAERREPLPERLVLVDGDGLKLVMTREPIE